ncbi:hypothetical protein [Neisseria chenwenguii]|uniref:hypothetical protein n=1 Tax=Neisseria chenwenguii TaxID=1853278 RepID=UPI001E5530E6|nr:hypothetical protein [Neisseria chenwenguii]
MNTPPTPRRHSLAAIAAPAAIGDTDRLKEALHQAFEAQSLTVNQAKDALVQLYAYCGLTRLHLFPKILAA